MAGHSSSGYEVTVGHETATLCCGCRVDNVRTRVDPCASSGVVSWERNRKQKTIKHSSTTTTTTTIDYHHNNHNIMGLVTYNCRSRTIRVPSMYSTISQSCYNRNPSYHRLIYELQFPHITKHHSHTIGQFEPFS